MKRKILTSIGAFAMMVMVSFGQLIDEKNVSLTMELQPILQLNLQGSDQIDFVFDDIYDYVAGITKYGATVLKVSSSVSFDLWATGLSTTANFLWDNPIEYGISAGSGPVDEIPITCVEIHQFPPNPTVTDVVALCAGAYAFSANNDYSAVFPPVTYVAIGVPPVTMPALVGENNAVFTTTNAAPYLPPLNGGLAVEAEKYIAGGQGLAAGCQVPGGTWLAQNLVGGTPVDDGYYFTLDYRILPGLPAVFPAANADLTDAAIALAAVTGEYMTDADGATSLGDVLTQTDFANPGVYTMYIKYILVQDQ